MVISDRISDYAWVVRNAMTARHTARLLADEADEASQPSDATFVLIPGIYEDARYFHSLVTPLRNLGFRVRALRNLGIMRKSTAELAGIVLREIDATEGPIVLLAHSKGSLVGRAVLAARPRNVVGLVALSAPWEGSSLARIFPPRSFVRRLIPGGEDVRYPWSDEREAELRERIVSIAPVWDPHIPSGSFLPGATNIELQTSGHFRSLNDPEALQAIVAGARSLLGR